MADLSNHPSRARSSSSRQSMDCITTTFGKPHEFSRPTEGFMLRSTHLQGLWPSALKTRIEGSGARVTHICCRIEHIRAAIRQFSPNNMPETGLTHYTRETSVRWGLLTRSLFKDVTAWSGVFCAKTFRLHQVFLSSLSFRNTVFGSGSSGRSWKASRSLLITVGL